MVELLFSGGSQTALVARFRLSAEKPTSDLWSSYVSGSGGPPSWSFSCNKVRVCHVYVERLAGGWCRGLSRIGHPLAVRANARKSSTTHRHCTCQHCKHRRIGLTCIALGDRITSPATPMFFGSSDSWMLSYPVFPSWKSSGHRAHLVFLSQR